MATTVALMAMMVQGLTFAAASHSALALASAATGSGGEFVATQGRVLDTRPTGATGGRGGYTTPMSPNVWRSVQVGGNAGVPSSEVSAVQVTVTALQDGAGAGTMYLSQYLATPKPQSVLQYGTVGGVESNTAIVAVASNGKIEVEATSGTDVLIDVQGYYTAGDPAAGGYVSVNPTRLVDTRNGTGLPQAKLASGSTSSVPVGGHAGVPTSASAAFINITVQNYSGAAGYLTPYAADETRPTASLNFPDQATTAIGTTVPLSAVGAMKLWIAGVAAPGVDVWIDVVGYFTAATGTGAFTPGAAQVATNVALASGASVKIPVAGVAGVPLVGSGIAAVAMNVRTWTASTDGGWLRIWGSTDPQPGTSSINLPHDAGTISSFVTSHLGNDGKIAVYNAGPASVNMTLSVQGWYSNAGTAISSGQNSTQQSLGLQAAVTGGGSWVTYQYRVGSDSSVSFVNVPVANVADGNGNHPSAWPVTTSGGKFTAFAWNIRDTLAAIPANNGLAPDALIQVQACYGASSADANPVCGMPDDVQFAQSGFNSATKDVGPGSLALLTGDFEVDAVDANAATALGGLSVGRSLTTRTPTDAGKTPAQQRTDASGVFGPGWTADVSGPNAGNADLTINDKAPAGYLLFTDTDAAVSTYQATTPVGTYPINFTGVGDDAGDGEVVTKVSASVITMTDPDGTVTTWTKNGSGSTTTWPVTSVQQTGSNSTSAYSYNTAGLVTRILAPAPSGVICTSPDTTPGCRSLTLTYQTLSVSGTDVTRLQKVNLSIPQTAGTANSIAVAAFDYTTAGLLADAYDPRITPNLKTAYTYNTAGRLVTLTPPGLAAYTLSYDSTGRLSTVSRPDPSGVTATSTVVYSVPLSGSGQPDLTAATTGTWDEVNDLPVTGTAIFPADHQPAGTTAGTVGTADWPYATVDFVDINGLQVNTAQFGAGAWQIDTSQFDANGNDVWDLTPGNRAQALSPTSDTDAYVAGLPDNVARANLLASSTVYDPLDPGLDTDTYGPTHPVTLHDGTVIDAQSHVVTSYDDNAPNADVNPATGTPYNLPTTVTTSAYNVASNADTTYPDANVTHSGYSAINTGDTDGWTLGQATTSTVQMGAAPSSSDLVTTDRYDTNGRAIEHRLPGNPAGGTAQSTITTYYSHSGTGGCASDTWAGLVCSTTPAAQPNTGNPLPVTTYSYDQYGNTTTKTETYGTSSPTIRSTATTYDPAERPLTSSITVTPTSAGGMPLPTVNYGYDNSTGLPTTKSTGTGSSLQTLTTGYDNLGQVTTYTDATGNLTTTGYDIDGRPASLNDGKGSTSYTYDSVTEHRGLVTSENIGVTSSPSTFTAAYDAAGAMTSETYPNGLVASTHRDDVGNVTTLNYAEAGSTWMNFTQAFNPLGQIATQSSPQSSQTFTYDPHDRLTSVQDTYQGACTTRAYDFDADSNRQHLKSYPANSGGACSITTTPTITATSYDQADRDTNTGYTYDTLGRTLTVPAADAQGIGSHTATTGPLTIGYDVNDMVATQAQGATTMTFTLDPDRNRIASQSDGATTTTNRYTGDAADSPSWAGTTATAWTRNLLGIDGNLAATANQAGTVTLQLCNPRGDIIATATDDASATSVASYSETTEYGAPRAPATAPDTYGTHGAKQRSSNDLAGLTLMGVRLYDTGSGRFLSTDPERGGNANAYVDDDPINGSDLSGKAWWPYWHNLKWTYRQAQKRGHQFFNWGSLAEDGGDLSEGASDFSEAFPGLYFVLQAFGALGNAVGSTLQHLGEKILKENKKRHKGVKGHIAFGFAHWYEPVPWLHWDIKSR